MIAKACLDQILQKDQQELLCISLLTNLKLVRNFIDQYDDRERYDGSCATIPLPDGTLDMLLHDAKAAKVLILHCYLYVLIVIQKGLELSCGTRTA